MLIKYHTVWFYSLQQIIVPVPKIYLHVG